MARKSKSEAVTCEEPKKPTVCTVKFKLDDLKRLDPLTQTQVDFFRAYDQGDYFITLHGVSGTGKSLCAFYKAIQEVLTKGNLYHKVVIIRSAVQSREQGFLPGGIEEKMSQYEMPYIQIAHTLFGRKDAWNILKATDRAEFLSTSFIRGMTFENSIVIVDEIQNMNYSELATITQRIGNNSKIIFCGDIRQNDLLKNKNDVSGLKKFLEVSLLMPCHTRFEFTVDDIVRSSLVKEFIIAELEYEDKE